MAATPSMEVIRVDGLSLAARSGTGHWLNMDNSVAGGGHDGAASPMELVLAGLAGCTAMDVLGMLEKMRAQIDDFRVIVNAERADEHPKVYTKIDLLYRVKGDVKPRQLERAIGLSHERYCSVSAMLKPGVAIEHHYELEPSTEPASTTDSPLGAARSDG
jgi:putative redox protein